MFGEHVKERQLLMHRTFPWLPADAQRTVDMFELVI